MSKLFYLETRPGCVQKVIDVLKSHGLYTDTVEFHYIDCQRFMHGELIMWLEGDKYPNFVHRAEEHIVRKRGTKVEY